jgi:hypothetical protein
MTRSIRCARLAAAVPERGKLATFLAPDILD